MSRFPATLFGKTKTTRNVPKAAPRTRLGLADLEARDVPAGLAGYDLGATIQSYTTDVRQPYLDLYAAAPVNAALANGTLYITGTDGADRARVTSNDSNQTTVDATNGTGVATRRVFNSDEVRRIHFVGGDGADAFTNDTAHPAEAYGGLGNDTLLGGGAADLLSGQNDDDRVDGRGGDDALYGGAGNDTVTGGEGNDTLAGGGGNDTLAGHWAGGSFVDDPGNDEVFGEGGDDRADGGSGNDYLDMGYDDDFAAGGTGDDTLRGGWGNDVLHGWDGQDELHGEGGDDALLGQAGFDQMFGGGGFDAAEADRPYERMADCERVALAGLPQDAPQTDGWSCGPNSASRVLRYYGHADATYSKLRAARLYDTGLFGRVKMGTHPAVLRDIMRAWKPDTVLVTKAVSKNAEGLEPILSVLRAGKPVVALINAKDRYTSFLGSYPSNLHWVAVTGFDQGARTITYTDTRADGNGSMVKTIGFDEFYRKWNFRTGGVSGSTLTRTIGVVERTFIY